MNPVTEYPSGRKERQILLLQQMRALLEGETFAISHMANAASRLWHGLLSTGWDFICGRGMICFWGPLWENPPACVSPLGKGCAERRPPEKRCCGWRMSMHFRDILPVTVRPEARS